MHGGQEYALVRSDLDTLLLPLLKLLYDATRNEASNMYMLLVILLILSQDAAFAAAVHTVSPYTQVKCKKSCMNTSLRLVHILC